MERTRASSAAQPMLEAIPIASPASAATLSYAPVSAKPPIDWGAAVRQSVFSLGAALLVFGVSYPWSSSYDRTPPLTAGLGALLIGLVVPWPGRFGRRR